MIMDRVAVRAPGLMGRVMVEAVLVQVFTVTRADIPRGRSTTRRAMKTMVSIKRIIAWILWLIPTRRTKANDVKLNRPSAVEGQVLIRTACLIC